MAVDFKTLNAKARNALSDADFAYIDSKGDRHLPIRDEGHVRDAMARFGQQTFESDAAKATARRKILAAARKFGIDVKNFSTDDPLGIAEFSVTFAVEQTAETEDDLILRGRLFKTGDYPEKHFSLTPDEMYGLVRQYMGAGQPAPMDLEHRPSVFNGVDMSGFFGRIEKVWASDDSEWLMADVVKPKWLHTLMPETRVSASFSREDKELLGAAWTERPHIDGADLVAAFAKGRPRHDTMQGQMAMQSIHDEAARAGALCTAPSKADMASRHERSAIQDVHDIATSHGAQCSSVDSAAGPMVQYSSPANRPDTATKPKSERKTTIMGLLEYMRGKAKEEGVEFSDEEVAAEFSKPALDRADAQQAAIDALKTELATRETDLQAMRDVAARHDASFAASAAENRRLAAVNFAGEMVTGHRVTPEAAGPLQALYERIGEIDSIVANFSGPETGLAEGQESTAALLTAFIDKLPDLSLFSVEGMTTVLQPNTTTKGLGDETKEYTPERREALLKTTVTGRAILAEEKKAGVNNGHV